MAFTEAEKALLQSTKGVGDTIIKRLEELGLGGFKLLAQADASLICEMMAEQLGSSCWKNSPQAKQSIYNAIELAKHHA